MAIATALSPAPAGPLHADEDLLDLVARVARHHSASAPEAISMREFKREKVVVDRARGTADPTKDPLRTPTAEAICLHFRKQARHDLRWEDIVAAALASDRSMWLAAIYREKDRPVTEAQVVHALLLVASSLGGVTELSGLGYAKKRDELVAADRELRGEDGILDELLPSLAQLRGQRMWEPGMKLAGLTEPKSPRPSTSPRRVRGGRALGMGWPEAMAYYAALNGAWAGATTLMDFARNSGFALQTKNSQGTSAEVIGAARALLEGAGFTPPAATKAKQPGRATRLSYEYPIHGIPGAPSRDRSRDQREAGAKSKDPYAKEVYEFCVLSLRAHLADSAPGLKATVMDYTHWQEGKDWASRTTIGRQPGRFTALREEARQVNRRQREQTGDAFTLADRERADELRELLAIRRRVAPERTVSFEDALAAVMAGPTATTSPPKQ